jgi:DNA-binding ferritin-like protein
MSNIIDDNIQDNFINPEQFTQQLQTLSEQLPSVLDDFKKYYVFYNRNPEYDEYISHFNIVKNNLNSINSKMFVLSNEVQTNIDDINEILINLNTSIGQLKTENNKTIKRLRGVKEKYNTANEMISNYKNIYEYNYLRNWGLLLSIVIAGFSISVIYKNKINS